MADPVEGPSLVETNANQGHKLMRITNHGQMRHWVSFVLKSLEENENVPVTLHTLPNSWSQSTSGVVDTNMKENASDPSQPSSSISTTTKTIPRLISVVEIIKREYIKSLEQKRSPRLAGLHQYNELGCLEDLKDGASEATGRKDTRHGASATSRSEELAMALSGKNHVKLKHTPYMKITLSANPLPELAENGATYQPPIIRKISKSAKMRAKKRAKKAASAPQNEPTSNSS